MKYEKVPGTIQFLDRAWHLLLSFKEDRIQLP